MFNIKIRRYLMTGPFHQKNIRPEMLRPEFEIYIERGNGEYIKQQKCTAIGDRTRFPGANSALIPSSMEDIVVKLPNHRVFIVLGPAGPQGEYR